MHRSTRGPPPEKTALFFVTANRLHVRPAVELSRRIAAAGSQAVRWDPAGLGLTGQTSRTPWPGFRKGWWAAV